MSESVSLMKDLLTKSKIKWAISTLKPFKSIWPDDIPPVELQ